MSGSRHFLMLWRDRKTKQSSFSKVFFFVYVCLFVVIGRTILFWEFPQSNFLENFVFIVGGCGQVRNLAKARGRKPNPSETQTLTEDTGFMK